MAWSTLRDVCFYTSILWPVGNWRYQQNHGHAKCVPPNCAFLPEEDEPEPILQPRWVSIACECRHWSSQSGPRDTLPSLSAFHIFIHPAWYYGFPDTSRASFWQHERIIIWEIWGILTTHVEEKRYGLQEKKKAQSNDYNNIKQNERKL